MIEYVKGDCIDIAKEMSKTKAVIIPHITNNIQLWGSGFVVALSKEWPIGLGAKSPEWRYRKEKQLIGSVQYVFPGPNICIANMCAQNGISSYSSYSTVPKTQVNSKPIRYEALVDCMSKVREFFFDEQMTIVAPKFGSLRAGGNWSFIEELIEEIWCDFEVIICEI